MGETTSEHGTSLTPMRDKVANLTHILSARSVGKDIIADSSADGGILLNDDEREQLIDLMVMAEEDIVPNYYDHNWVKFMTDYTQVLFNLVSDYDNADEGDLIADIRDWFEKIKQGGKLMVDSNSITFNQ